MRGFDADVDGYYGSLSCSREVSAVGEECMLSERSTFEQPAASRRPTAG